MCLARLMNSGTISGNGSSSRRSLPHCCSSPSLPAAPSLVSPKGNGVKLPSMSAGDASWPKLASFDWPPPPSPANALSRVSASTMAASHGPGTAKLTLEEEKEYRANSRLAEIRARTELWAARAELEREKMRSVAPFPFFGCAMRFQDEFAALQITEDGRFSYSSVTLEASNATGGGSVAGAAAAGGGSDGSSGGVGGASTGERSGERCGGGGEEAGEEVRGPPRRRVVTYEGVFATSGVHGDDGEEEQLAAAAISSQADPETAAIEGRALERHEEIEEANGRARLVNVERGSFRFAFTVSPFFQPTSATVQLLVRPRSPGRLPPRPRRLPYVGVGGPFGRDNVVAGESPKRRKAPHRMKANRSIGLLPPSALQAAGTTTALGSLSPGMNKSSSSPQLPALQGTGTYCSQRDNPAASWGAQPQPPKVTDWKEFYRQRAEMALGHASGYRAT